MGSILRTPIRSNGLRVPYFFNRATSAQNSVFRVAWPLTALLLQRISQWGTLLRISRLEPVVCLDGQVTGERMTNSLHRLARGQFFFSPTVARPCTASFWLSALSFVHPISGAGRLWIRVHGLWNLRRYRRRGPTDRCRLAVIKRFFVVGPKGSHDTQSLHFYSQRRYLKLFQPQNFVDVLHTSAPKQKIRDLEHLCPLYQFV